MYRQSRPHPRFPLLTLIILGLVIGVSYYLFDNASVPPSVAVLPTMPPAATPLPTQTALPTAPAPNTASLFIPSAGVMAPIIPSYLRGGAWDVSQLGMKIGHLQGTAWLDQAAGNVVLSGHVEMANGGAGIFANLHQLNTGDPIIVQEPEAEYHFVVTAKQYVAPDDMSVVFPTDDGRQRLTLITCSDYNFLRNRYEQRLVILAERQS